MNLAVFLERARRLHGQNPAVAVGQQVCLTYETLGARAAQLAAAIKALTANSEDTRVALFMENCREYLEIIFACWYAGVAAVPVNAKLHPTELVHILTEANCRICFSTSGQFDSISGQLPECVSYSFEVGSTHYNALFNDELNEAEQLSPDAPAWIFYTSGTTGKPKGAILTHGNLTAMASCYFLDIDPKGPWETIIHAAPMSHGSGLYSIPHVMKGSCHVIPDTSSFAPEKIFDLTTHCKHAVLFAAPTMVKKMVIAATGKNTEGLRLIIYGGGPMYLADCKAAIRQFGPEKLVQLYGQGESPMTITSLGPEIHKNKNDSAWESKLSSVGTAQSLVQVRIADGSGSTARNNEVGEVLVAGPTVMSGYLNNPAATAQAIKKGWLHTGDYGHLDDSGFLTLRDRRHDLIISGGTNIYPREVEEALSHHKKLAEVAVIGRPDPDWGERVVAYFVCKDDQNLEVEELDRLCLSSIARFKRPKNYRRVKTLPKNNYGKILKTVLRAFDSSIEDGAPHLLDLGSIDW